MEIPFEEVLRETAAQANAYEGMMSMSQSAFRNSSKTHAQSHYNQNVAAFGGYQRLTSHGGKRDMSAVARPQSANFGGQVDKRNALQVEKVQQRAQNVRKFSTSQISQSNMKSQIDEIITEERTSNPDSNGLGN